MGAFRTITAGVDCSKIHQLEPTSFILMLLVQLTSDLTLMTRVTPTLRADPVSQSRIPVIF
jgi:hypothetical protein